MSNSVCHRKEFDTEKKVMYVTTWYNVKYVKIKRLQLFHPLFTDYTLVEVTLKVQDLNDEKPVFKNKPQPFLATVSSNPAMGETVYTLLAEDPDKNSQLLYNLESGMPF